MNPPAHYRLAKPALTITRSGQSPLPLRSGFTGEAKIWQVYTGGINAPGLGSGPQLGDGSYALLLVSDDGIGAMAQRQDSFSLILRGVTAPAPTPVPIEV